MNQEFLDPEVLIETQGDLAVITLNRPKVLNALSLEMIRSIASALHRWRDDPDIKGVLFKGAGGRAFCSGGDIKSFYYAGMEARKGLASPRVPVVFFAEEYSLNKQIFYYPKSTVALMGGLTMGGGYGIAGHCDVRIASSQTLFAMPEVGIGFFPDVASVYHLHQCPSHYGRYLALTGNSIDGKATVAAGLADIIVEKADEAAVIQAAQNALSEDDFKAAMIGALGTKQGQGHDLEHIDIIERVFAQSDVGPMIEDLEREGSDFARETAQIMLERCPTSLAVTAAYLDKSKNFDFDEVIAMDFVLLQHFIRQDNMYEGIRAQLIDKDKSPKWMLKSIKDVTDQDVNTYFTSTGYDLKDVQIF